MEPCPKWMKYIESLLAFIGAIGRLETRIESVFGRKAVCPRKQ